MCVICNTPEKELITLIEINCFGCPLLTTIPSTLVNLQSLKFSGCKVTTIPSTLINLKILYCSRCPLLTTIPSTLIHLQLLDCQWCPLLTAIPATFVKLNTLYCSYNLYLYIPFKIKQKFTQFIARNENNKVAIFASKLRRLWRRIQCKKMTRFLNDETKSLPWVLNELVSIYLF